MKKRIFILFLIVAIASTIFFGCSKQTVAHDENYNGRVFYEIFVRAFNDSNKDGIGDLKGVTEKLDYLKGLGIKGIWLMPINESPSYHGYDVSDYYKINPDYGTVEDFKELIKEAHKRDIKVEMDMVINHTSTENEWFKEASADPNSKYRDYYIWTKDGEKAKETSAISAAPWTPLGDSYYYSLFWSGMPDLNYDNKAVRDEMKKVAKYYLDMDVDGFRLDAAKWIYNEDGKNIDWWQEYNKYVKSIKKDAVLVGEVWDNNSNVVAPYYKALDSCFNFSMADALVKGISNGAISNFMFSANFAYESYKKENKNFIDSPFLSNHDMNRAMDSFQNIDEAKQAAAILLTLPGAPYVYYGEETGMTGIKPDEQIRQPFIWDNKDITKNTSWEKSDNDINKVAVSVQQKDKNSLLNFYKTLINLRNNNSALKLGGFKDLKAKNDTVVAYKRSYKGEEVYIYVNAGNKKVEEKIDFSKSKVLYSNKSHKETLKNDGKIKLDSNEILIIQKK